MPSDSKKREQQRKKDARNKKVDSVAKKDEKQVNGNGTAKVELTQEEILCQQLEEEARLSANARSATGNQANHRLSRDIKIENFSITFYGHEILLDTNLELNCGRRYGLLGSNGCGKSTMLNVLGAREVPVQDFIDIFLLSREVAASSKTALEMVMEVDQERIALEKLAEELSLNDDEESQEELMGKLQLLPFFMSN